MTGVQTCALPICQLDYIWHGFHFTNQIPYRFSFLFSFVLLYMGYRAWLVRDELKIWQILVSGGLSMVLLLINEEKWSDTLYVLFNVVFVGLYLLLMLYGHKDLLAERKNKIREEQPIQPEGIGEEAELLEQASTVQITETKGPVLEISFTDKPFEEEFEEKPSLRAKLPNPEVRRRYAALGIAAVMVLELGVSLLFFAATFTIAKDDYPKGGAAAASMFQVMKELENDENQFYRAEVTHAQTLNDGALNGYNGLSTFSSSANVRVTEFMEALGSAGRNSWNRYCWEESSPVANLFLNLKYMMHREGTPAPNSYFDVLHSYESVTLMRNNAYLPMGFLADSPLAEVDFEHAGDKISLQNELFRAATGEEQDVWSYVPRNDLEVTADDTITLTSTNIGGYTGFQSGSAAGKITYTYTVSQTGFMCMDLTLYAQKKFSVWHNGVMLYSERYSLPYMIAVCDVKPGDTVELIVECALDVSSAIYVKAAVLDQEIFRSGYEKLAASTLELTESSTTKFRGVIDCDRDGLLYTSIPQCGNERTESEIDENGQPIPATTSPEGNWVAYVDGKRVPIKLVGNAMVAVELTEGIHEVEFRYENKAFEYGKLITLGCATAFISIIVIDYVLRRRKDQRAQQAEA